MLCKLDELSSAEVDTILTDLAGPAIVLASVSPAATSLAPDPGDQFFWDLLAVRSDLVLVTRDRLLLQADAMQQRVILPQTFVAQLQHIFATFFYGNLCSTSQAEGSFDAVKQVTQWYQAEASMLVNA